MPPPLLHALLNPAAFALRQALCFRRRGYTEGPLDLSKVSARLREQLESPRVRALAEAYGVDAYRDRLGHAAYTKSLFACDVLDRTRHHVPVLTGLTPGAPCRVLDVGTKNFESAPGLWCAAQKRSGLAPEAIQLAGAEIDPYVIYRSLYSRADAAAYYAGLLPGRVRYLPGDVCELHEQFDLITWFFPFLTPSPLLWWGLPWRLLRPEAVFTHVLRCVAPGGTLVLLNHSEEEREVQRGLFVNAGISPWAATFDDLVGRNGQPLHVFAAHGIVPAGETLGSGSGRGHELPESAD